MLTAVLGAALAVGLVLGFRHRTAHGELRLYGFALLIAAAVYVGFALVRRSPEGIALEGVGFSLFGLFAMFGWKGQARWLAIGWLIHVAWNFIQRGDPSHVPLWSAWFFAGFDPVIAVRAFMLRNAP
jgi:hypothetical protein